MMKTIREFFAHPIIQVALALAVSVLTLSWFAKRVFLEPFTNLELGAPALLASLHQGLALKRPDVWYARTWARIALVLGVTALIILRHA